MGNAACSCPKGCCPAKDVLLGFEILASPLVLGAADGGVVYAK